jgi:hypothetical protein
MAKGKWSKYNPKTRCYKCGYVIKRTAAKSYTDISSNGTPIHPIHSACISTTKHDLAIIAIAEKIVKGEPLTPEEREYANTRGPGIYLNRIPKRSQP